MYHRAKCCNQPVSFTRNVVSSEYNISRSCREIMAIKIIVTTMMSNWPGVHELIMTHWRLYWALTIWPLTRTQAGQSFRLEVQATSNPPIILFFQYRHSRQQTNGPLMRKMAQQLKLILNRRREEWKDSLIDDPELNSQIQNDLEEQGFVTQQDRDDECTYILTLG